MKKILPVWLVSLIDILLAGAILCTFSYFHHIRILWGEIEQPTVTEQFIKDTSKDKNDEKNDGINGGISSGESGSDIGGEIETGEIEPENRLDTSGDFGASFPHMFTQSAKGEADVTLTDDAGIRAYAKDAGLELQELPEGKFISLYRSNDIFVSLFQVDTNIYFESEKKTRYVQYFVYDIYIRNIENLFTVTTPSRDYSTKELIKQGEAASGGSVIATINGDYLGNTYYCLLAERNGLLMRESKYIESDICVLYYDGRMETQNPKTYDLESIKAANPYQIWNFGPSLLDENGKALTEYASGKVSIVGSRNPRSAIGYYEPGHYSFVVVDGRSSDSKGVQMIQLSEIFETLGCKVAYNMDGGDSAQAYFGYTMIRGDEERGNSQRKLFDIICIGEVKKNEANEENNQ